MHFWHRKSALGLCWGMYITFPWDPFPFSIVLLQVSELCPVWLHRWELKGRIKCDLNSMVKIYWIEESMTTTKVAHRVKLEFIPASKPHCSEGWQESGNVSLLKEMTSEFLITEGKKNDFFFKCSILILLWKESTVKDVEIKEMQTQCGQKPVSTVILLSWLEQKSV